jgi:hypothetical protein
MRRVKGGKGKERVVGKAAGDEGVFTPGRGWAAKPDAVIHRYISKPAILFLGLAVAVSVYVAFLSRYLLPTPNLWVLTGGIRLLPPNCLGMVRRFTGVPH